LYSFHAIGVALALFVANANNSHGVAKGFVIDNISHKGVAGASVTINDKNEVKTDAHGQYQIQIPADALGKNFIVSAYRSDYGSPQLSDGVHDNGNVVMVPPIWMKPPGDISMTKQSSNCCCCCCCCDQSPPPESPAPCGHTPPTGSTPSMPMRDPISNGHDSVSSATLDGGFHRLPRLPFNRRRLESIAAKRIEVGIAITETPARLRRGVDFPIQEAESRVSFDKISLSFRYEQPVERKPPSKTLVAGPLR